MVKQLIQNVERELEAVQTWLESQLADIPLAELEQAVRDLHAEHLDAALADVKTALDSLDGHTEPDPEPEPEPEPEPAEAPTPEPVPAEEPTPETEHAPAEPEPEAEPEPAEQPDPGALTTKTDGLGGAEQTDEPQVAPAPKD